MKHTYCAALVAALLGGCVAVDPISNPTSQPVVSKPARTVKMPDQVMDASAARRGIQLRQQANQARHPQQVATLRLQAAEAFERAGLWQEAVTEVNDLQRQRLPMATSTRANLIRARIALASGQPQQALRALQQPPVGLDQATIADIRAIRADAWYAQGNRVESAKERILLDPLLDQPSRQSNHQAIWQLLRSLPLTELQRLPGGANNDIIGWWALAYSAQLHQHNPNALTQDLQIWQDSYAHHGAGSSIVPQLLARIPGQPGRPVPIPPIATANNGIGSIPRYPTTNNVGAPVYPPASYPAPSQPYTPSAYPGGQHSGNQYPPAGYPANTYPPAGNYPGYPAGHYPGHPVSTPNTGYPSHSVAPGSGHTALLLPLTGRFSSVAEAMQDGFDAANKHAGNTVSYRVYDTGQDDGVTSSVYARAVAEGAGLVIGPMHKAGVMEMAAIQLDVPVIALNYLEANTYVPPNLYQFGLNPADDARTVARQALADGRQRAAILVPDNSWGVKIAEAFRSAFEDEGGIIADSGTYPRANEEMSGAVKRLVRPLWHDRRRFRPDAQEIDMVFLAARPANARLLRPLLKFHNAIYLPVYSSGHVYQGNPSAARDRDLNGITFCSIPWQLSGPASTDPVRAKFVGRGKRFDAMRALGADSHKVAERFAELQSGSWLNGYTGDLAIGNDNHIVRHLSCAKFRNGLAETLEKLPHPAVQPNNQFAGYPPQPVYSQPTHNGAIPLGSSQPNYGIRHTAPAAPYPNAPAYPPAAYPR